MIIFIIALINVVVIYTIFDSIVVDIIFKSYILITGLFWEFCTLYKQREGGYICSIPVIKSQNV